MVRIPLNEYVCRTSRGELPVPTFRDRGRRLGTVVGPEGTALRTPAGEQPKLKVPKDGRVGEYWLLSASETLAAAAAGRYGLAWVPAAQGVAR